MIRILFSLLITAVSMTTPHAHAGVSTPAFVRVKGTHFELAGHRYVYVGANFWQAMNLGATNPKRLNTELKHLHAMGADNLRIMASSQGPDTQPWRIVPSLEPKPRVYRKKLLIGLDRTLAEMQRLGMHAVICLSNFWPWSGGFAQYVNWTTGVPIPYPPPQPGGSWSAYQHYAAQFYSDTRAIQTYDNLVRTIVTRRNSITGRLYRNDPTIMAWELANEPRGDTNLTAFHAWISTSAALIKHLDSNHLVTTGTEGTTPWPEANGLNPVTDDANTNIDYATTHLWVQNWGWYDPKNEKATMPEALNHMRTYIDEQISAARRLGKPLVLEEFGLARDGEKYGANSTTHARNHYFAHVFNYVFKAISRDAPIAGLNFWAWAGAARPVHPGGHWQVGNPLLGDPPHEPQGWYSVYDSDSSTIALISRFGHIKKRF